MFRLVLCSLFFLLGAAAVRADDEPVELDLAAMPDNYRRMASEAAPGVKWEHARLVTRTSYVDGKEEKSKVAVLSGKDGGGREVTLTLLKNQVDEVSTVVEPQDLPRAVGDVFLLRARYGKPIQITAEGPTLKKPSRYAFLYDGAAVMTVSADGKKVDTFGLPD